MYQRELWLVLSICYQKIIDKEVKRGKVPYDVNIRTISAFREIEKGHVDIETFRGYMNMPPTMNKTTYQDSIQQIHSAYTKQLPLIRREMMLEDDDGNDGFGKLCLLMVRRRAAVAVMLL